MLTKINTDSLDDLLTDNSIVLADTCLTGGIRFIVKGKLDSIKESILKGNIGERKEFTDNLRGLERDYQRLLKEYPCITTIPGVLEEREPILSFLEHIRKKLVSEIHAKRKKHRPHDQGRKRIVDKYHAKNTREEKFSRDYDSEDLPPQRNSGNRKATSVLRSFQEIERIERGVTNTLGSRLYNTNTDDITKGVLKVVEDSYLGQRRYMGNRNDEKLVATALYFALAEGRNTLILSKDIDMTEILRVCIGAFSANPKAKECFEEGLISIANYDYGEERFRAFYSSCDFDMEYTHKTVNEKWVHKVITPLIEQRA